MTKLTLAVVLALSSFASSAAAQRDVPVRPERPILDEFDGPTLSFGARLGATSAEGVLTLPVVTNVSRTDKYTGAGATFGGEIGAHFAPAWTFFGSYDYAKFDHTSWSTIDEMNMHTLAVGFRATTNRRSHVGFVAEVGAGYRWLGVTKSDGFYRAHGVEPLRAGIGVTVLATDRVRVNVMASVAAGLITHVDFADHGCVNSNPSQGTCDVVPEGDREWQIYRSLTIGGTFDL